MRQKTDPEQLGTIEDGTTYPMAVFMKKAGIGKHALSMLRKQGLKVIRTGGRAFVRGRDFSEFLAGMNQNDECLHPPERSCNRCSGKRGGN